MGQFSAAEMSWAKYLVPQMKTSNKCHIIILIECFSKIMDVVCSVVCIENILSLDFKL